MAIKIIVGQDSGTMQKFKYSLQVEIVSLIEVTTLQMVCGYIFF